MRTFFPHGWGISEPLKEARLVLDLPLRVEDTSISRGGGMHVIHIEAVGGRSVPILELHATAYDYAPFVLPIPYFLPC